MAQGVNTSSPLAAMNCIRVFLWLISWPFLFLEIEKPLPPTRAIAGIKISKPGLTIDFFKFDTASSEPNSSIVIVDMKKVAMHRVATIAAIMCILFFIGYLSLHIMTTYCHYTCLLGCDNMLSLFVDLTMKNKDKSVLMTEIILETFKLNGLLVAAGDQLAKEFSLTSARWKILGALADSPQGMTVPDIAREMGQSRQAVQRLANEMIKDELLESYPNPNHERAKLFLLTGKGKEKFSQIMDKQGPWANAIAEDINEVDLTVVANTLKTLNSRLGS